MLCIVVDEIPFFINLFFGKKKVYDKKNFSNNHVIKFRKGFCLKCRTFFKFPKDEA